MAYTKINPGSLRTPVLIQRVDEGKDEDNRPTKTLKTVVSCKASVYSYKGKQEEEAQSTVFIDEKKITIRKPKVEILDTDVLTMKGRTYDITSIVDLDERGRYYELKVRYSK